MATQIFISSASHRMMRPLLSMPNEPIRTYLMLSLISCALSRRPLPSELILSKTTKVTIENLESFLSATDSFNTAMHKFQLAVTGFGVRYDGVAATLAISRRRMVVPIYKRWEAQTVRIQIIQQENVIQFCAYMEDFSHADAMNFQIKSMDVFEKIELKGSKGERGRYGLRLVDAKFWLPPERKKDSGPVDEIEQARRRFACLDMPVYPGEHDDITLGFETEAGEYTKPLIACESPTSGTTEC